MRDFIYFYVGSYVGSAIVMNGRVFHGANGNAGAFGSIPTGTQADPDAQLIASSSLITLEKILSQKHGRPVNIRAEGSFWQREHPLVSNWMDQSARSMARAALSVVAALDITNVVIDGVFPAEITRDLLARLL